MRFALVHKTCSYLTILTSSAAIFSGGELNPVMLAVMVIGLFISWFWEPPTVKFSDFTTTWNVLTVLVLMKTVFDIATGESVLISAIYFIVFLSLNKLFNRQSSSDYLQLYVVSLLQMIAGTALTSDLTYGLLFLAYIVFVTWTLMLFHLKREMEENLLLKYGETLEERPVEVDRVLNSRRVVGWRFLGATSMISLVVFAGAATFFFLFPRVGFRLFSQSRPGIAMAGFSTQVELGHFGRIKDNATVVMRVEFDPPDARGQLPLYWRGISFDRYDGKSWQKSNSRTKRTLGRRGGEVLVRPTQKDEPLVSQQIYLEPMESRVLFGLDQVTKLSFPQVADIDVPTRYRAVQRDIDGDLFYEQLDEIAFRYNAHSRGPQGRAPPDTVSLEDYADLMRRYEENVSRRFRQRPSLDPRVEQLAAQVVGDARTVGEAVARIESHLKENYGYTLDLKRDVRLAPLEDFLFIQRQGHCEYFASSMVMLLRSVGIGARLVNGFQGGRWNTFGNYLAVTQGEAHSWVEVLVPQRSCRGDVCHWSEIWHRHDPTPSGRGGQASSSLWTTAQQYADAFRMRWYKYVIEYDLEQQIGAVVSLRDRWNEIFGDSKETKASGGAPSGVPTQWVAILVILVLILGVGTLAWQRRRETEEKTPRRINQDRARALAATLLRRYETLGWRKDGSETLAEFLARMRAEGAPNMDVAAEVVQVYEVIQFGGEVPDEPHLAALELALRRVERPQDTTAVP